MMTPTDDFCKEVRVTMQRDIDTVARKVVENTQDIQSLLMYQSRSEEKISGLIDRIDDFIKIVRWLAGVIFVGAIGLIFNIIQAILV